MGSSYCEPRAYGRIIAEHPCFCALACLMGTIMGGFWGFVAGWFYGGDTIRSIGLWVGLVSGLLSGLIFTVCMGSLEPSAGSTLSRLAKQAEQGGGYGMVVGLGTTSILHGILWLISGRMESIVPLIGGFIGLITGGLAGAAVGLAFRPVAGAGGSTPQGKAAGE